MRVLVPFFSNEQEAIAARDVERAVQYALLPITGDGDAGLASDATVTTVEWRRLGNDSFIQHQDDGPLCGEKPAFKPPFACRHVFDRNES